MECLQLPRDELDCFPRHDPGRSPQQADQGVLVIEVAPDRLLQLVCLDDPGSIESLWSIDLRFGTNQDERLERGGNEIGRATGRERVGQYVEIRGVAVI